MLSNPAGLYLQTGLASSVGHKLAAVYVLILKHF